MEEPELGLTHASGHDDDTRKQQKESTDPFTFDKEKGHEVRSETDSYDEWKAMHQ